MKGFITECCQYFKGELPEGWIYYNGAFRRFREGNWRGHAGYVYIDNKRVWLYKWQIEQERKWLESIKK
jgi:hypothetical protein